jgi:hypothetical protein
MPVSGQQSLKTTSLDVKLSYELSYFRISNILLVNSPVPFTDHYVMMDTSHKCKAIVLKQSTIHQRGLHWPSFFEFTATIHTSSYNGDLLIATYLLCSTSLLRVLRCFSGSKPGNMISKSQDRGLYQECVYECERTYIYYKMNYDASYRQRWDIAQN